MDMIEREDVLKLVHETIYGIMMEDDEDEDEFDEQARLLLKTNKAICRGIKQMQGNPHWIVHCKDCKYWYSPLEEEQNMNGKFWRKCHKFNDMVVQDGYCFMGEDRRWPT